MSHSPVQAETGVGFTRRASAPMAHAQRMARAGPSNTTYTTVLDARRLREARRMLGHEIAKAFDGRGCWRFARPAPVGFHIAAQDRHEHAIGIDRHARRREKRSISFQQRVLIADKRR
jgi:hypothetical protein